MRTARTVLRVALVASLALVLLTPAAFAIEPVGKSAPTARDWSQVFTEINTSFDHVQFLMVDGAFAGPIGFEGITPAPPDEWVQTLNNGQLVLADGPVDGFVQYRLNFAGTSADPLKFYYQVWLDDVIVSEDTVEWIVDPLQGGPRWAVTGGSEWSDVRVEATQNPTATLRLQPDAICYDVGDQVIVELQMSDAPMLISGGQFFLDFNPSKLEFVSMVPGGGDFVMEIYEIVDQAGGTIDYSVGVDFGAPGTMADSVMAVITFNAINEVCKADNLITFRQHDPPSRLTASCGDPVYAYLYEQGAITIDSTPPEFGPQCIGGDPDAPDYLPENYTYTVECDALDTFPVYDIFGELLMTATDNCTLPEDIIITFDEQMIPGDCLDEYTLIRTWTAEDECGDMKRCQYYLNVVDTSSPCLHGCPDDVTVECDSIPVPATVWAEDNCDPMPVVAMQSWEVPPIGDPERICLHTYTLVREWTATDRCGNHSVCTQYISVQDTTNPEWIDLEPGTPELDLPADMTVACDAIPTPAPLGATDNCPDGLIVELVETETDHQCPHTFTLTRTWTATDDCGNYISHTQLISVIDEVAPVLVHSLADEITITCEDVPLLPGPLAVTATDNCDDPADINISFIEFRIDGDCPFNYTLNRTWTATDLCDNSTSFTQIVHVIDETDPVITCPADIVVDADVGHCSWTGCPAAATATDNCSDVPDIIVVGYRDDAMPLCGYPYPIGITTITWVAVDECGNMSDCEQTVEVLPVNDMEVTLLNQVNVNVTRCITFELWDCETDTTAPVAIVSADFDFFTEVEPGVRMASAVVEIPCNEGPYDCIVARDTWHSLSRQLDLVIEGDLYVADFALAGKVLLGGNANDDCVIDILDFGAYNSWFGWNYGTGDTLCGWFCTSYPPGVTCCYHVDFGGNGSVGSGGDFSYIQVNYLETCEDACCGRGGRDVAAPITDISVKELHKLGLGHMAVADLNKDGRLNSDDIVAYMQGARPEPIQSQNLKSQLSR